MEAKFLASVFSFLSIFLAMYAQADDLRDFVFETTIYYGDSNVNIGEPFSITCIIPLGDAIHWLKDGEPITRHNLRHGRDEHSYTLSESAIEGEKHKIEAHISVRHALKVHEGKYQCNTRHSSYHMLHVRSPIEVPKPQTKSPFIITSNDNHLSTESMYETIHDLTPSSADDIFTRIWEPEKVSQSSLPTQSATTTTHRRQHHHHHQLQQQLQQQQQKENEARNYEQHKFIYINSTNLDGNPIRSPSSSSTGDISNENVELINLEYMPPTSIPGRSTTKQYPPMPDFPPPRTSSMLSTTAIPPPPPPPQYYIPVHHGDQQHHYHGTTANTAATAHEPRFPPQQTMQTTYQTIMYPTQTSLTPFQRQFNQMQTYPPHQQHVTVTAAAAPFSPTTTLSATSHFAKTNMPIRKGAEFLQPNYDYAEKELKFFEIRSPLVLSCNVTEGNFELTWEKNGTNVAKIKELEGRYKIIKQEKKFVIERTEIHDDGTYYCVANDQKRTINVVSRVIVRVPSNINVVEGEKLSIPCTVAGTNAELSWSIGNLTISNTTGRYVLKPDDNNIKNAILSVENISLEDRGEFKCIGHNDANEFGHYADASDVSYIRVKGKFAALWPFLGICAEVLILCVIILVYERKRNKTELEESDTDQQEQKKKRRNYD